MTAAPVIRLSTPLLICLALLLTSGCQSAPAAGAESEQVLTRLYFGLSRPGGTISAEEFDAFVDAEITPRFPNGFTLIEAQGAWRDRTSGETEREGSRVLEVLHQGEGPFEALIERYKERFEQQSVLRVDLPARARF